MASTWKSDKEYERYGPTKRIMKLFVFLLKTNVGMSTELLAEKLNVTRRTVLRYLDVLEECGVDVRVIEADHGRILRSIGKVESWR
jgi:predicted DNA-binding transcriptional regulator YafY